MRPHAPRPLTLILSPSGGEGRVRGKLRTVLVAFVLGLLAAPFVAHAQQPAKVFRIGILSTSPPTTPEVSGYFEAFFQGLRELGYVEGQNMIVERRYSEGRQELLPDLAANLVRVKVDVIVAMGTPTPVAAKRATETIPIVMTNTSDPVALGLVRSLARPGGNVTGLSIQTVELVGKQLQLLKQVVPKASRVAFLTNPSNPGSALQLREAETAARSLRVQLQVLEARRADELDGAFATMIRELAGAVLVPADPGFFLYRTQISDLAMKSRLPAMFALREHAEAGGLLAYGPPSVIISAALPPLWTRSSRARSPPTCPWSSPRSSSWSSISRPPRRSA